MPTPPKPFSVLSCENKSHRTKAELIQRKEEELALASGKIMRERSEVKNNEIAHKEYMRINKLLKKIEKNDALYEPIINRYCLIQSECIELEERREEFYQMVKTMRDEFSEAASSELEKEEKFGYMIEFGKQMAKMTGYIGGIDKSLQQKRKMLLDIEKESIMTVASALRSIPKKPKEQEEKDPMALLMNRRKSV